MKTNINPLTTTITGETLKESTDKHIVAVIRKNKIVNLK